MKLKGYTALDYVLLLILAALGFIFLYPVYYVFCISFSNNFNIASGLVTFFPRGFNTNAYRVILNDQRIPLAYWNTIKQTVACVGAGLFFTSVTAYPLSRKNMWGRGFFIKLIVFTMYFSGGMIPTFLLVSGLGLIDTIWALVLPGLVSTYYLLIIKSFYESLSSEIYESATIDGASEYRILFQFFLPLSKAALATAALFLFVGRWNAYFGPLIYFNDTKKYPLQLILRQMIIKDQAVGTNQPIPDNITPEAMKNATIAVSILPVLLVYPFAQRYFVQGVMLGAVKG